MGQRSEPVPQAAGEPRLAVPFAIPDDRIDGFIEIWKGKFGQLLSREDARDIAGQLLTLYAAISRRTWSGIESSHQSAG